MKIKGNKMKKISVILCTALLSISTNAAIGVPTGGLVVSYNMGKCVATDIYNASEVTEADRYYHNRLSVRNDVNSAVVINCPIDMRADLPVHKVEVVFSQDTASVSQIINNEPDDPTNKYYIPECTLNVSSTPGSSSLITLTPAKSVSWGHYNTLIAEDIIMPYPYNTYTSGGNLRCTSPYYGDRTFYMALRVTYAPAP
jgi:hypothetical protein